MTHNQVARLQVIYQKLDKLIKLGERDGYDYLKLLRSMQQELQDLMAPEYFTAMSIGGQTFAGSRCFACGTDLVHKWMLDEPVSTTGCTTCHRSFVE